MTATVKVTKELLWIGRMPTTDCVLVLFGSHYEVAARLLVHFITAARITGNSSIAGGDSIRFSGTKLLWILCTVYCALNSSLSAEWYGLDATI